MSKLVYGTGVSEAGEFSRSEPRKEYSLWVAMLARCYSPLRLIRRPTYIGCSVSDNFKNFQWFAKWCQSQIGFGNKGFQLDKDLLFKNNKMYSGDNCIFVPDEINSLLVKANSSRGECPIGVSRCITGFRAEASRRSAARYIGVFDTPEEAFLAYKLHKEALIKQLAEKWKSQIDPRAYEALMKYTVEITD